MLSEPAKRPNTPKNPAFAPLAALAKNGKTITPSIFFTKKI